MAGLATAGSGRRGVVTSARRRRATTRTTTTTRTLISSAQLNRRQGRIAYRVILTLVIVVFTLVFIGPLYFLFTDGLKSTQEAIATPPTLYPHHVYPSTYVHGVEPARRGQAAVEHACTTHSARWHSSSSST